MVTAAAALRSLELHPRTCHRPWCGLDALGVVAELALQEYHREKRPRVDDPVRREADEEELERQPVIDSVPDASVKLPPLQEAALTHHPKKRRSLSRRRPRNFNVPSAPAPASPELPPQMPEPIRSAIAALGGTEAVLVIEKPLTKTDTKREENRLSIPIKQATSQEFLNEGEKQRLELRDAKRKLVGIEAQIVEPDGRSDGKRITFKRWDMEKANGRRSSSYVLNHTWYELVFRHDLQPGTLVQVWSFRLAGALCFALAVIT